MNITNIAQMNFEISKKWYYQQSLSEFKSDHGLDLGTLKFDLKNTTPDITPPKVRSES